MCKIVYACACAYLILATADTFRVCFVCMVGIVLTEWSTVNLMKLSCIGYRVCKDSSSVEDDICNLLLQKVNIKVYRVVQKM